MAEPRRSLETRLREVARAVRDALRPDPPPFPERAPSGRLYAFRLHRVRLEVPRRVLGRDTWRALHDRTYERGEMEMLGRILRPGDTVLEIGAALGLISARAAAMPGIRRVVAVEANPDLIPVARQTYALNAVAVDLLHAAVARANGEVDFHLHPEFWASSTEPRAGTRRVRVPARGFAELLAEVRPDVLIVDVEGAEVDLLEGLRMPGVRHVMLEVHPWATGLGGVGKVFSHLAQAGFAYDPDGSSGPVVTFARTG